MQAREANVAGKERAAEFEELRPLLFGIAYRMLGSATEAEDIVQEAYLRWHGSDAREIHNIRAYLAAIVTRLSIDQLRSARVRRETYVGTWLPEPVLSEPGDAIEDVVTRGESLTLAYLTLLERLQPVERAVLLLHDIFDFEFTEIAPIVDKTPVNCRKIASRARARLESAEPAPDPPSPDQQQMAEQFVDALMDGDMDAVVGMLREDAILWSDSGGKAIAPRRPLISGLSVAKFLVGIVQRDAEALHWRFVWINRQPGVVVATEGKLVAALVFDVVFGRISSMRLIANPDKLLPLAAGLDETWMVVT